MTGIEPVTSSLPRKCSTSELHRLESGRRDSNPRPTAWKAVALPTELRPLIIIKSGGSRIRTYEDISQQIYSLPHLTALVSPQLTLQCFAYLAQRSAKLYCFLFITNFYKNLYIKKITLTHVV